MSPTELAWTPGPEDAAVGTCLAVATGLRALLGARAGQLLLHSVERALGTAHEWLHRYLPSGAGPAGKSPRALLGVPVSPPQDTARGRGCPCGTLASIFPLPPPRRPGCGGHG